MATPGGSSKQRVAVASGQQTPATEFRVYLSILDLQPQVAAYLATPVRARGYPPVAGDHSLIIEVAPALAIHRIADLALKSVPELGAGILFVERQFGVPFYDATKGGSPVLWQHMFWFYSHPAVYIMILPAFGMISEIFPTFARKPIFGYKMIAFSSIAIALLGFMVWAHHMFTSGLAPWLQLPFMILTMFIAIPTGIKIFSWLATLWRGVLHLDTPMLFTLGFLTMFTLGGISGVMLAVVPFDIHVTDTYFVVAHIHYVLFGGSVFGIFAGLYYWFPKMSGRFLNERLGKISFWLVFIGFNATFLVQHALGLSGMPRRIYTYEPNLGWSTYNLISTIGAFILGVGVLVTIVNVWRSLKVGALAGPDPWKANTLEWFTTSPPPPNDFDVIPRVRSIEPMRDIRRQIERQTGVTQKTGGGERYLRT